MRLIRVSMERQATRSGVQWAPTWSARSGGVEEGRVGGLECCDGLAWAGSENTRGGTEPALRMVNVSTRR